MPAWQMCQVLGHWQLPLAAAALASCSCRCTAAKSACSCLQRACSDLRLLRWWEHPLAVLLNGFLPYRRKSPSLACKLGSAKACRGWQVAAGYRIVFQGCHAMLTLQQRRRAALPFRRSPAPPAASRPPGWSWRPPLSAAPAPHNMLITGLRQSHCSRSCRHAADVLDALTVLPSAVLEQQCFHTIYGAGAAAEAVAAHVNLQLRPQPCRAVTLSVTRRMGSHKMGTCRRRSEVACVSASCCRVPSRFADASARCASAASALSCTSSSRLVKDTTWCTCLPLLSRKAAD
jgi:hypothetical protein